MQDHPAASIDRMLRGIVILLLASAISGCALFAQATTPPSPTPDLPTRPPVLTSTPSPNVAPATATTGATRVAAGSPSAAPPTAVPASATAAPAGATATPTVQQADPVCLSPQARQNLYKGPATVFDIAVTLGVGEQVRPLARSQDSKWLQVVTLDGIQGWLTVAGSECSNVDLARLPVVNVVIPPTPAPPPALPPTSTQAPRQPTPQPTATPRSTPTPAPTPTTAPVIITDWRGEYYDNPYLAGAPVVVRNEPTISFDWGQNPPAPGLPPANFSGRWTRALDFGAGYYRFYLRVDDGARLFIDDVLVLDTWQAGGIRTLSADVPLSLGAHRLRVEYFQGTGYGGLAMWWETAPITAWRGEYFSNPNLAGSPFLLRNDQAVNFNWGQSAPATGMPANQYSVRWMRDLDFDAGRYRFSLRVDDGVRFWIDGALTIDEWHPASSTYSRDLTLAAGRHNLRVEYVQYTGDAGITLSWERLSDSIRYYRGEYYNNVSLTGAPVLVRDEPVLDLVWPSGPDPRLNPASFSARWRGQPIIDAGAYRLRVEAGGGVRVWINNTLMVDAWRPGAIATQADMVIGQTGPQDVRVEYFQQGAGARVHVWWIRSGQVLPQ